MATVRVERLICKDLVIEQPHKAKKLRNKLLHLIITFIFGVAFATIFHLVIMSHQVRTTAEAICNVFGKDADDCKNNIDNVFDMADDVVDNNINVTSGK